MPNAFQSIRFRLSLAISLVVFSVGTLVVGGLYLWQVNSLDEPTINVQEFSIIDSRGQQFDGSVVVPSEVERVALVLIEQRAYREALATLRSASFAALAVLFIVSFATGYMLSGWTLRPVKRITQVANEISASDLSQRIGLVGPNDELKGVADTFDQMLDRLQRAFEDQRRFISEASHELRNPLAVAQANLELALSGPEDEMRSGVEIAHRATGRVGQLVDGLLSQARQGVPELRLERFEVGDLVAEVAKDFSAEASERGLRITASRLEEPSKVLGDPSALRQVVANLVANAVKFAPNDTEITLTTKNSADAQAVVISVADDGPGIALEDQGSVFEPFWQADRSNPGAGLGLNIVRQLVERFGGTVGVSSQLGKGSTFVVRLPLALG
jgi:signal transduction histidine kinase